ncbi:transcription antitermination factor NusG [Rhizobium sp. BK313]|uniref:transcription termination/antitermination NusG family protein n=1 Tax=Rhizobium sp. BK313 TaxID=2587081 RepID=UPI00161FFA4D|nr:transcription termination/antitermination NusG family protein [Rhizobium sp. BK313]MBB3453914.1 transcription antitermination factor NusG [Rhizobium sp. BK313]
MAAKELWYCIRTAPGAQRNAKAPEGTPGLLECVIERNLRNEGFRVFMPTVHYEVRHSRTKKWVERRFPLLVGYAFVDMFGKQFEDVRRVEGVMCFLRRSVSSGPYMMPERDISALIAIEEENRALIHKRRAEREARDRRALHQTTRKDREQILPKDTIATICGKSPFSGLVARVIGPSSRGKVKAVIETLDSMLELDIPLENLEAVA